MIESTGRSRRPARCWPICMEMFGEFNLGDRDVLLLASQSPRRQALLDLTGWAFHISPAEVDERSMTGEGPGEYVTRLATAKVQAVFGEAQDGWIVIGSDTAVVEGGEILGKPTDREAAVAMLRRLRGHSHQVYSAVAISRGGDGASLVDVCVTEVPMRAYSEAEIQAYVASGDPMD